jgi:hypothetical protein
MEAGRAITHFEKLAILVLLLHKGKSHKDNKHDKEST